MVERLIENDGIETALRDVVLYIPRNDGHVFNPAPGLLCDGDMGNTTANIAAEGCGSERPHQPSDHVPSTFLEFAYHTKPVISILKLRRNTGARGAPAHLDVMPP